MWAVTASKCVSRLGSTQTCLGSYIAPSYRPRSHYKRRRGKGRGERKKKKELGWRRRRQEGEMTLGGTGRESDGRGREVR